MQTRIEPKIVQRTARPWWIWSIPFVFLYMGVFILRLFSIAPGMAIGCFPIPIVLSFIYWHALEEINQRRLAESRFNKNQGVKEKTTEPNGTKASLENTQSLLEALIEQLPIPVVVASAPDTIVRYSNRAAKELLGVEDESAYIGQKMQEVQKRMTWQEYWADGTPIPLDELPLVRALHGEVKRIDEYKIIRKDGSFRWIQASGTPIYNPAGDMIAGLVVFPDITERKQAEESLRESDFLFRSQFNHGNIGLAITSPEKRWLRVNARLCKMLGYSEEEFLLKTWAEMTYPDDLEADVTQFTRLLAGEIDSYELDKRFINKDGQIVETHLTVSCYRNPDRSAKFIIASLFDITSKKRHEWQIVQEKLFSEKLVNTLPGIFYLYDEEMNVVRWNRNLELVSGFTEEEIRSRKVLDWFSTQETKEKVYSAIERMKQEGYGTGRAFLSIKEGREIPYLFNGASIEIDGKRFLLGIGIDLQDRYHAEEALRKSEDRLRSIIESSPMGVHLYELDADGRLIFTGANPASDRILGLDCKPLIGKTIEESFPPLLSTEVPDRYRLAAREGVPWHSEHIDYEDDRIRGAYEIFVFQTSPGRMASFFQDISERKKLELEKTRYFEEIERFNRLFVGREQRIIDLKRTINDLSMELKRNPVFDLTQIDEMSETDPSGVSEGIAAPAEDDLSMNYELTELIDLKEIQPLLNYFSQTFGVATGIVSLDGKILVKSFWQAICTEYHRINSQTCQRCIESDTTLSNLVKDGDQISIFQCRNGLTDAAAPIRINGRPIAIVFVGQFLLTPPDLSFFQRQAADFGFEESGYLEALRRVPVIPEEKLSRILGFLSTLSELIAQMGVDRIRQKQAESILEQRANELDASNRELLQQRAAAISLAEDAEIARAAVERTQTVLKENEERFRILFEYSPISLWEEDFSAVMAYFDHLKTEGVIDIPAYLEIHPEAISHCAKLMRILDVNQESVRLHEAASKDDLINGLTKTFTPETYIVFKKELIALCNHRRWLEIDTILQTLAGEPRYVTIRWQVPKGYEETYARVIVSIVDITERKRSEEEREKLEIQLRQAQKMEAVGQLAGGVAHDFNNLLQVINGYSEMALHTLSEEQRAYKYLQDVEKAGKRAAGLVSQLLAFSRRQLMKPEDLDLNEVIANLLKMMGRVIGEHIRLDFIPGHPLGMIFADRNMMDQVIMNLCVNARDAMPGGGTLSIETRNVQIDLEYCEIHSDGKPGRYILVSVTDTGCGMDEDTRAKIFEPFFTTKEPGQGTGLGLATVYGIVKQHDGMIQVYSEINKGTCFNIYLPANERIAAPVAEKMEEAVACGTETILVAEDDEMVRSLTQQLLETVGYTVLMAKDGEEALQLFDRHAAEIQLLLLDVVMPKKGGREVYDCVRKRYPSTRVLFASGYSENAVHTNFVLEEGLQLIQKPYNRINFLLAIRRMLDTPR